jgi:DNA-binding transcriptional regulator GbsR (MarR family)
MQDYDQACDLEIFKCYSAHLEQVYKLPPLTAKLQTFMVLQSSDEGFTFEELLEVFKVSKSSLSNSINYLLSTNQIEYINKINSRKRYFRLNAEYLPEKLEYLFNQIKHEHAFSLRINKHREKLNRTFAEKNGLIDVYIEHLEKSQVLFEETLQKINKIQLENK